MSALDDHIEWIGYTRMRQLEPISDVLDLEVGIVTCMLCGAAILLDPADSFDMRALHTAWHSR